MTMENNDFDIFEIIKLLLVQKWKLLGLTLMFFIALFAFQYSLPSKYNVKFTIIGGGAGGMAARARQVRRSRGSSGCCARAPCIASA